MRVEIINSKLSSRNSDAFKLPADSNKVAAASAVRFARTKHCFESGSEESLSRTTSPGLGRSYKRKIRSTKIARREKILWCVCLNPLLRTFTMKNSK